MKRADAFVAVEVGFDVVLGFASAAMLSCAARPKGLDAVDDAEVDGLGAVAGLLVDLVAGSTPKTSEAVRVWMSWPVR